MVLYMGNMLNKDVHKAGDGYRMPTSSLQGQRCVLVIPRDYIHPVNSYLYHNMKTRVPNGFKNVHILQYTVIAIHTKELHMEI